MQFFRELRRRTAGLALLAMLAMVLMPTLSHALGQAAGADAVEICTAQGKAWVQADASGDGPRPAAAAGPLDHCPYCSLGTQLPALLPAPLAWVPPARLLQAYPERFYRAARTPQAWRSAQPRAPPSFS